MLSPIEVKKQEFGKSLRGYDSAEVRSFLETVAGELEHLNEVNRNQAAELERLKAELATFQRMEKNMKDALVNAQEAVQNARADSKREAELVRKEALFEAEQIVQNAKKHSEEIKREIDALTARRDSFVRKVRALLRSELDLIQLLEEADSPSGSTDTGQGGV